MDQQSPLGEINVCLTLLCGLPGAGKTSLAESLKLEETGWDVAPTSDMSEASVDKSCTKALRVRGQVTILHLCYDNIIPRQLAMDMRQDSSCSTELCQQNVWINQISLS